MSGKHGGHTKKKKSPVGGIAAALVLLALLGAGGFLGWKAYEKKNAVPPQEVLAEYLDSLGAMSAEELSSVAGVRTPATEDGRALLRLSAEALSIAAEKSAVPDGDRAELPFEIAALDVETLAAPLNAAVNASLAEAVEDARVASEVYDEDWQFRGELVRRAFSESLAALDPALVPGRRTTPLTARLSYAKGVWTLDNSAELAAALFPAELSDPDAAAEKLFGEATAALTYVRKHYSLPENTLRAPAPIAENFGSTRDKSVIRALLERPEAKALIGEQTLSWNEDIELLDDTPIWYYLDETILVLTWQELTANAVGTFSEVFIADGSQIIRRIGGDRIGSEELKAISVFARDTNAVLAVSADFYKFVYRDYGAIVYQRELYRFNQRDCDSCFFTADGDMLFAYAGQFEDEEDCKNFIRDNDVVFSVAFGPVIIDNGEDVMPEYYRYGEIWDTYARTAIGLLGERHYLTMDVNKSDTHHVLVTLRQAVKAMLAHGCVKAYTLDGGQTAETVFNGQVINPLQKPWEKPLSDAICFVSAYPGEG